MSRSLTSILRLRSLLEEERRIELENTVQHASRIEDAQEGEVRIASAAFSIISEKSSNVTAGVSGEIAKEKWNVALVDREMAHLRQQNLVAFGQLMASRAEALRGELIVCRIERLQVESLLRSDALRRARELARREQRVLDDWFTFTRTNRRQRLTEGQ